MDMTDFVVVHEEADCCEPVFVDQGTLWQWRMGRQVNADGPADAGLMAEKVTRCHCALPGREVRGFDYRIEVTDLAESSRGLEVSPRKRSAVHMDGRKGKASVAHLCLLLATMVVEVWPKTAAGGSRVSSKIVYKQLSGLHRHLETFDLPMSCPELACLLEVPSLEPASLPDCRPHPSPS